jgi:hypothetical protein
MKRLWLLVLVLVSFNSLGSQEVKHAPTVEQCRADQKLWLSKLEEPNDAGTSNVSFNELSAWGTEMGDCATVDPSLSSRYRNTETEAAYGRLTRLENFISRHKLIDQFIAEDLQGKR